MQSGEFKLRRTALIEHLAEESVVLIAAAREVCRSNDSHFPFRQDSDFYYLTGFSEPEALMVLIKEKQGVRFILFNRPKDELKELWEGIRAGQSGAVTDFDADEAFDVATVHDELPKLLAGKQHVYYRVANDEFVNQHLPEWIAGLHKQVRLGVSAPEHFHDVSEMLSEMRLFKSNAEIETLRKVCQISAQAHVNTMKAARDCKYEYQLQAQIEYDFKKQGCQAVAYTSIVAAGKNACVLHYTDNNAPIKSNDLILIDAGGELDNYASDITRTFPKSGKFNEHQKAIYQVVLDAQKAGIEIIKPGLMWTEIQRVMVEVLCQGLLSLGILKGSLEEVIDNKTYRKFYMHNSGHWLGLDVHDKGQYKENGQWRPLKPGMVLTVEPGIYINDSHQDIEACWHNIGVRIEDDILVTSEGHENLTAFVPKEISEIEALMFDEL